MCSASPDTSLGPPRGIGWALGTEAVAVHVCAFAMLENGAWPCSAGWGFQ